MKRYWVLATALLVLSGLSYAGGDPAGEHHAQGAAPAAGVTVTGQIVDPVCLTSHGASGPDHRSCAQACAKVGINLAFYNEKDGQLYMIFPTGHADPNEKVIEFAEKHVEITGIIHKAPGYQGLEVQTIKELGEGQPITLK